MVLRTSRTGFGNAFLHSLPRGSDAKRISVKLVLLAMVSPKRCSSAWVSSAATGRWPPSFFVDVASEALVIQETIGSGLRKQPRGRSWCEGQCYLITSAWEETSLDVSETEPRRPADESGATSSGWEAGWAPASHGLPSRSQWPEVRRARRSMPWKLGPPSPKRWRARLSSVNRFPRRVCLVGGCRLLVCVSEGYVVFARGLLEPLPTIIHCPRISSEERFLFCVRPLESYKKSAMGAE